MTPGSSSGMCHLVSLLLALLAFLHRISSTECRNVSANETFSSTSSHAASSFTDEGRRKLFLSSFASSLNRPRISSSDGLRGAAARMAEKAGSSPSSSLFKKGEFRKKVLAKSVELKQGAAREISVPRHILEGPEAQFLTRDAKRYNDLEWGFDGYDPSFDDHTCEPVKHFVYIKTHKTGSSTLCNMVHRFVMKHNLSAALPWSNQFYAWPSLRVRTPPVYIYVYALCFSA